jgi:hypothetical protein
MGMIVPPAEPGANPKGAREDQSSFSGAFGGAAIAAPSLGSKAPEKERRADRHQSERQKRPMDSRDHSRRAGPVLAAEEKAARSEATATPKLIDICWTVLEMLLPGLRRRPRGRRTRACSCEVNCMEETKPRAKAMRTICGHRGPRGDRHEEDDQRADGRRVEEQDAPVAERFRIRGISIFRLMAASGWGMMRRPDWTGV